MPKREVTTAPTSCAKHSTVRRKFMIVPAYFVGSTKIDTSICKRGELECPSIIAHDDSHARPFPPCQFTACCCPLRGVRRVAQKSTHHKPKLKTTETALVDLVYSSSIAQDDSHARPFPPCQFTACCCPLRGFRRVTGGSPKNRHITIQNPNDRISLYGREASL